MANSLVCHVESDASRFGNPLKSHGLRDLVLLGSGMGMEVPGFPFGRGCDAATSGAAPCGPGARQGQDQYWQSRWLLRHERAAGAAVRVVASVGFAGPKETC
jgi:hypothetical protein